MKSLALLFNGVVLPYWIVDESLEVAERGDLKLHFLFIYKSTWNGSGLPVVAGVTLEQPMFRELHAETNLIDLISSHQNYVTKRCQEKHIPFQTTILNSPVLSDLSEQLDPLDSLISDPESFLRPKEFAFVDFSIEQLTSQFGTKIQWRKRPVRK